jgi:5-methylcytosine-specific restriction endonuclease McrA
MTGSGRSGTGNAVYRRNRALLLSTDDVCQICGHAGAETADHIVPARLWPRGADGKPLPGMDDLSNLRPAHGTKAPGVLNRCPVCSRLCNQSRGSGRAAGRPQTRPWL